MKKLFIILLALTLVFSVLVQNARADVRYVTTTGTGLKDGTSWANAYDNTQLQIAINESGITQVWVAKGTYKPTVEVGGIGDRYKTFQMKNGVEIYGGFAGIETDTSQRTNYGAGQTNETILSGDIGTVDDNSDNCYHVFYHPSGLGLNSSAVLDGFTITSGNANGSSSHSFGGGMYNDNSSSPTLIYCTFSENYASERGGGVDNNSQCSPAIINCTFSGNYSRYGGGMNNFSQCSPAITNCKFLGNYALYGGGIYNYDRCSPVITNCTFSENSVDADGGGIWFFENCSPSINNSILWGNTAGNDAAQLYIYGGTVTINYSCYADEITDISVISATLINNNNINTDPRFVGSGEHPYLILGISPCVDAGGNSYNMQDYDVRGAGYPRKLDKNTGGAGTIDMGAYEYKLGVDLLSPVSVETVKISVPKVFALAQNYPNPFNPSTSISFDLPKQSHVILKIYDVIGREVAMLANGEFSAGNHKKVWDASSFSSGVYFYQFKAGNVLQTKKLVLLK